MTVRPNHRVMSPPSARQRKSAAGRETLGRREPPAKRAVTHREEATMVAAKPQGRWRYEDLFDLPADKRYEIIDGELYEMPAPRLDHEIVTMSLAKLLSPLVDAEGGYVFSAPVDVFLPRANPVQPDLMVVLPDRLEIMTDRGLDGPPSIVVEILSPSNPDRDLVLKRDLYARSGIPEYWLVDVELAAIEVLVLDSGRYRTHVRATGDQMVTSLVLPDPAFPAAAAFARLPVR
jgi:Uma2 family endonuclease